jgi:uncharacterized protein
MGEVVWLGRYPVKSMLGEEPDGIELEPGGVRGDRRYALVDEETGLVASAKNPRRWRALLAMRAGYRDGRLVVTLPDGRTVLAGDAEADSALSRALGRRVRLTDKRPDGATLERLTPEGEPGAGTLTRGRVAARVAAGQPGGAAGESGAAGLSFVDFAAVHVVTTATLDALGGAHPLRVVDARRLRPNVVVRMRGGGAFAENGWPGRRVAIGDRAALRVVVPTPRCVVPTLAQGPGAADSSTGLPEDPEVLRAAARLNRVPVLDLGVLTCVGAYADVEAPGRIRVGDLVRVG